MNYYIWSIEHNLWWKSNGLGYTSDLKHAGVYAEERAITICMDANLVMLGDTPSEAMVPAVGKEAQSSWDGMHTR